MGTRELIVKNIKTLVDTEDLTKSSILSFTGAIGEIVENIYEVSYTSAKLIQTTAQTLLIEAGNQRMSPDFLGSLLSTVDTAAYIQSKSTEIHAIRRKLSNRQQ